MFSKTHITSLVAAFTMLLTLSAGCYRQSTAVAAQALQAVDDRKDAATLTKEAEELIRKGDGDAAILRAEVAVQKDPRLGEAQKTLALAYCAAGRVAEAVGPAQKAVELSPDLDRAHYVLGLVLYRLGRTSEALRSLEQAARINPKYDQAHFLLAVYYDLLDRTQDAQAAVDRAVQLQPDVQEYRRFRDSMLAYAEQRKNRTTLPQVGATKETDTEYASWVYSGIFYEALVHHDFDLLERAVGEARTSKQKLRSGTWKLQFIYSGVERPYTLGKDYEWKQQLDLLDQWVKAKPDSSTAKTALAACYVAFAWNTRGPGYANTVSEQKWKLFYERLDQARNILSSIQSQPRCPKWYALMQQIALAQNWDKESYERLFEEAVKYEPGWYEYYKLKAMALLPRWHGNTGELEAYVNSFAVRHAGAEDAMLYFLVNEYVGFFEVDERQKPALYYQVLRQGYLDLRKTYGATTGDTEWAYTKAMLSNDIALVTELFPELKGKTSLRVTKEMFDAAVKEFESTKKPQD
jgi:tetratricopeptide (TPR) repeat protein